MWPPVRSRSLAGRPPDASVKIAAAAKRALLAILMAPPQGPYGSRDARCAIGFLSTVGLSSRAPSKRQDLGDVYYRVVPSVTEPSHAVFLSYASQDAQAALKICDTLRAAGIDVFFDQSELRGGDAWDQKIRREIHDCALFLPVISANTAARHEGYFRLEWDLADQRTHMIARNRAFIVP